MVSGLDAIPENEKVVRIFAAVASKNDVVRFFAATTSKCVEGNQFEVNTWQLRIIKYGPEVLCGINFNSIRWKAERHRDLLKVLRILARIIAISVDRDKASSNMEPTAVRMSIA